MTESTLSLQYSDFQAETADFLGLGRRGPYSVEDLARLDQYINAGLRRFYHPPLLPGQRGAHRWSFLRPTTSLTAWADVTGTLTGLPVFATPDSTITATVAKFFPTMIGRTFTFDTSGTGYTISGYTSSTVITVTGDASSEASGDTFTLPSTGDYQLPDDYGALDGDLTFTSDNRYWPVPITSESIVRNNRRNGITATGRPQLAAIRPKASDGSTGQRFELMLWPISNSNYVLDYRFAVQQNRINSTNPYPLGGMAHAETILASILAVAEERAEDSNGIHNNRFMTMLASSINRDEQDHTAESFGYNGDASDGRHVHRHRTSDLITYNGSLFDGS